MIELYFVDLPTITVDWPEVPNVGDVIEHDGKYFIVLRRTWCVGSPIRCSLYLEEIEAREHYSKHPVTVQLTEAEYALVLMLGTHDVVAGIKRLISDRVKFANDEGIDRVAAYYQEYRAGMRKNQMIALGFLEWYVGFQREQAAVRHTVAMSKTGELQ